MTKDAVSDWSSTASDNSDVGGIVISEFCAAANINNALREIMAQVKTWAEIRTGIPQFWAKGSVVGTLTGGQTIPLEVERNNWIDGASLSGNRFTLPTGWYYVRARAFFSLNTTVGSTVRAGMALRGVTDGVIYDGGRVRALEFTQGGVVEIEYPLTVESGPKVYELQAAVNGGDWQLGYETFPNATTIGAVVTIMSGEKLAGQA